MLTKAQQLFLNQQGYQGRAFPMDKDTLLNAEILSKQNYNKGLSEKILNLPLEKQEALIDAIERRPKIDFSLAVSSELNQSQFGEHLRIAHYNHEVEYGSLKDTGKAVVDKSQIINPKLSSDQLFMIAQATNEGLQPQLLVDNYHKALSENEMHEKIEQMRINKVEVKAILAELNINVEPSERLILENLHLQGKFNPDIKVVLDEILATPYCSPINGEKSLSVRLASAADKALNPEQWDQESPKFNVSRMSATQSDNDIPVHKLDGYDGKQSNYILRTPYPEPKVDPTPFITPANSYQEIDVVSKIMRTGQNPCDYSPEQITKLGEIFNGYDLGKNFTEKLLNPKLSTEELKHFVDYELANKDPKLSIKHNDSKLEALSKDFRDNHNQENNFPEITKETEQIGNQQNTKDLSSKFILTDAIANEKISINTNEDVLKYFEKYDSSKEIEQWRESGLIETKRQFHYLTNENPERVAYVLNHEFKTEISVQLASEISSACSENTPQIASQIEM
jgi:hypothetical protein